MQCWLMSFLVCSQVYNHILVEDSSGEYEIPGYLLNDKLRAADLFCIIRHKYY